MATDKDTFYQVLEAVKHLSLEQRQKLLEYLSQQLEAEIAVRPLALMGTWAGVSLSAEEIDEARQECWAGLGDEG